MKLLHLYISRNQEQKDGNSEPSSPSSPPPYISSVRWRYIALWLQGVVMSFCCTYSLLSGNFQLHFCVFVSLHFEMQFSSLICPMCCSDKCCVMLTKHFVALSKLICTECQVIEIESYVTCCCVFCSAVFVNHICFIFIKCDCILCVYLIVAFFLPYTAELIWLFCCILWYRLLLPVFFLPVLNATWLYVAVTPFFQSSLFKA